MAVSVEDIAFATELFEGLGAITTRKIMGGLCLYQDGVIFALLYSDGQIFLKAQGDFITEIQKLGGQRWTYQREGKKTVSMPYYTLPDAYLDDPEEAQTLARRALEFL
ncbi:MAG: TfoX/Sxy family protein [Litoreibacter sp.]|nr:TfoX/Sxy family protein [Litoreibacter sp.]